MSAHPGGGLVSPCVALQPCNRYWNRTAEGRRKFTAMAFAFVIARCYRGGAVSPFHDPCSHGLGMVGLRAAAIASSATDIQLPRCPRAPVRASSNTRDRPVIRAVDTRLPAGYTSGGCLALAPELRTAVRSR